MSKDTTSNTGIDIERKLKLLKDEQGDYVISSLGVVTPYPMKALVDFIEAEIARNRLDAVDEYIITQLGWMEPNKDNLTVDEIIGTLKSQLQNNSKEQE